MLITVHSFVEQRNFQNFSFIVISLAEFDASREIEFIIVSIDD